MATVKAFIRTSNKRSERTKIRFRLSDGRSVQIFHVSEIEVPPLVWDNNKGEIKAKVVFDSQERLRVNNAVSHRKSMILDIYNSVNNKKDATSEWLEQEIDKKLNPGKYQSKESVFFSLFDDFLQKRKLSDVREKNFMVLRRALQRYELIASVEENVDFKLDIHSISSDTIEDFENFLRNEHTLYDEHKDIYDEFPAIINSSKKSPKPRPRGTNTINALFNKLRAFFNWCNQNNITTNRPFDNYESKPDLYGTPYYITIEERNQIYSTDLSHRPQLAIQRDIFILQCLLGCRMGDYYKMTRESIINNAVEYIPRKTKDGHPITVRVPLNDTAKEILKKYDNVDTEGRLMPFISEQKYNEAIKEVFTAAGITRIVTVLNSTTRQEEKRPINEIASSHLARRTFVGNLYKKVKDPNLVGSLSGHKEGSKAFARYREIDEEMKIELVKSLE
ncbi:site-specific integrase [Parabacteroides sp. PF5-6]|uniref:site-specific integrase n=1 Tax=Parabacteroides sp. PF5-6 TaxID=1742403 RepID=UPI0024051A8D|nr:site-specific integrase [Parabacteroides sp. PF5-6]MDF9829335.1 integrase [Parabacteroides sp. PF5-6]